MLVTASLDVELPVLREDGTPLNPGEIATVQIWRNSVTGSPGNPVASGTPADFPLMVDYDDSVDNYFSACVYDIDGLKSEYGPELYVPKVVIAPPSAPGAITVF